MGIAGFYTLACDYFFITKNPDKFHEYIDKVNKIHS